MPDIQPLVEDVGLLRDILFGVSEQQLETEQNTFVQVFEDKISRDAEFAEKYKKLVESRELHTTIKSDLDAHLNDLYKQAQETAATLKDIQTEVDSYNEEKRNRKDTWEAKRMAYLEEIQSKQKSFDTRHRRELDKLEEKYAKLTRESIYANLVGTNNWNYK